MVQGQRSSGLVDALQTGVLLVDHRGNVAYVNPAAQRLLNCGPDASGLPARFRDFLNTVLSDASSGTQHLQLGSVKLRAHTARLSRKVLVELHEVSDPSSPQQAPPLPIATLREAAHTHLDPLVLLAEALATAEDPVEATELLADLQTEASALVQLPGPAPSPQHDQPSDSTPFHTHQEPDRHQAPTADSGPPPLVLLILNPPPSIVRVLRTRLNRAGLQVAFTETLQGAVRLTQRKVPDCVVLDTALDDADLRLHGRLRTAVRAPMVILSDHTTPELTQRLADQPAAVVLGNPFRLQELVHTIRQLLPARERGELPSSSPVLTGGVLTGGDVALDLDARCVHVRGRRVQLTLAQFQLLRVLMAHAGQVVSYGFLVDLAWKRGYLHLTATIAELRRIIERDPANPVHITTVRGVGYRFDPSSQTSTETPTTPS